MRTSFTPILQRALDRVPGAIAAVFADADGEAVDQVTERAKYDALIYAAHYGVLFNQVQSLLRLFHFGAADEIFFAHTRMDIVLRSVGEGYYLLLAATAPSHVGIAQREARFAALALRQEMLG